MAVLRDCVNNIHWFVRLISKLRDCTMNIGRGHKPKDTLGDECLTPRIARDVG